MNKNALIFRDLEADEIECRIATVNEKGLSLLLYKDARCDMNILDETVGAYNWQRRHSRENANCSVEIWDEDKRQWIAKEDTGTESFTEAQKGLASDSFKRACFNWGIGRELYTAPFIWIKAEDCTIKPRSDGKYVSYDKFKVQAIAIKDKRITGLSIYSISERKIVYTYGKVSDPRQELKTFIQENGLDEATVCNACGLNSTSGSKDFKAALEYARGLVS